MGREIQYLTINYKTFDDCLKYVQRTIAAGWIILKVTIEYDACNDIHSVNLAGYID